MPSTVDINVMILREGDTFYFIDADGVCVDVPKKMVVDVDYNTELDVVMTLPYGFACLVGLV